VVHDRRFVLKRSLPCFCIQNHQKHSDDIFDTFSPNLLSHAETLSSTGHLTINRPDASRSIAAIRIADQIGNKSIDRFVRQLDELQYDDDADVTDESDEYIVRPPVGSSNGSSLVDNRTPVSGKISLISWRWETLGSYFVISAFLLTAAGVKICYHHSRVLHTHVPESW
jgi:hypothetical protein